MTLNEKIGEQLKKIRGTRTQEKFVEDLAILTGNSRSYYSMVEIGKRPASLKLLDVVSSKEGVSYDYIFGVVNSRVDIFDSRYQQLLEMWGGASDKQKAMICKYTKKIIEKEGI